MRRRIEKAVVLGAGTMGARIAAHFANAGLPCILLDIVPPNLPPNVSGAERNKIVRAGLEAAKKSKPAAFFTPALTERISIGNFEDDLARCAEADWIIEVVAENLEIKRKLLSRVAQVRKPGAIVTTNTSGLPVHLIAEGMSEEFQQHWAGTHFFNPPRYLKLVEVIPGPKTLGEVIETLSDFCGRRLGKGVVIAKDTPNFIANRIGTYSMLNALRLMSKLGMTIEEVDACTGPAVGWPKSATFRTADLVGLDVLVHVVKNIYETAPNDESREMYQVPAFVEEMTKRGWLGDKTGQGFYKRVKGEGEKEILTLDVNTLEYRPRQKARFDSLEVGKSIEDTKETKRSSSCGARFPRCACTRRGAFRRLPTTLWTSIARYVGALPGNSDRSRSWMRSASKPSQDKCKKKDARCHRSSKKSWPAVARDFTNRRKARRRFSIFAATQRRKSKSPRASSF